MGKLTSKLRIGEQIGFGFGLVGLLFLGVIWQYHGTLQRSLDDYQRLQDVFGATKDHAQMIENHMLEARQSEKDFLNQRNEAFVEETAHQVEQVLQQAAALGEIDSATADAKRIAELMTTYHQRFRAIVEAWRTKGLDHDSGLQGAFRDAVHELETMAGNHKVGRLYLQLLQIRRGEKDLGLRRDEQYRTKVLGLIEAFKAEVDISELEEGVKRQLSDEIEIYRETFEVYADAVLADEEIHGGKGPFRQSAHRLEALLLTHYVPDLESNILQLRRREKDYLLRGDKQYVEIALQELDRIQAQVEASAISAEDKSQFMGLMGNYRRDFLALVEQNDHITRLTEEMNQAVTEISSLVKENVDKANQIMDRTAADINATSRANANLMLWIVAVATLLGILFAISITLRIGRPLQKMAGTLDRLAYEESTEHIPFVPNARDEVEIMAESVNTIVDHKARFIAWWKTSMEEADAGRSFTKALETIAEYKGEHSKELGEAEKEMWTALIAERELLADQNREIARLNDEVTEQTAYLLQGRHTGEVEIALNNIRHSVNSIREILSMIHYQAGEKKTAAS